MMDSFEQFMEWLSAFAALVSAFAIVAITVAGLDSAIQRRVWDEAVVTLLIGCVSVPTIWWVYRKAVEEVRQ